MSRVIIEKLSAEEKAKRGIVSWPIWEKEVSRFDWYYDSDEECQILEGEVVVETSEGNFNIKAGDFVTFKKGLKCVWDIKKDIRKHYNFK
ncbi:MAG TPA: cupin domain-containing protein [Tenuifilaceae bacterium]|nr:cupin domain-containing protein [Tenuifilaceae bacterium]HPE18740.1 cupin domain-containing protein [Tenuifilaceae bacterium]HPJ46384.1 cupin domain-containing protein [Tenuifilaceae bacterium]HPQ34891.1 cupin domain-containing protein [Tenuifilaceae bacterium]HRX68475.1 cupin domain-containing protein [Tenuifilaceae bacterium]